MTFSPITLWQVEREEVEKVTYFLFFDSKITVYGDCSHEIKMLAPLKRSYDRPRQCIKKQTYHLTNKGPYSQSCFFQ